MPFQKQPFTLDYRNKCLILETPESMAKRKKDAKTIQIYLNQNRSLSVDIFVNVLLSKKKELQFLLDSGSGKNSFWINSRYLSACAIDINDTAQVKKLIKKSELNKDIETVFYRAIVPLLSLKDDPDCKKENVSAIFSESLIYEGKVSIDWLGNQVTFDLNHKEIIVQK